MEKQNTPNYNFEGVDLNVYTARRSEDVEYYADKLDYLKEFHKERYNMITEFIEMSWNITHDIRNTAENLEKNYLIREISRVKSQKDIKIIKRIVGAIINNIDKKL